MSEPNVTAVVARVIVDDIDRALPLYQEIVGTTETKRFAFRDVELASVGPFLLLSGNTEPYRDRVATVTVRDLQPILDALEHAGGEVVEGPVSTPNGERLIARHPDGSVFEYIATP